ncbi:MAG: endonuclease MutS2 [Spirochaetes bacterium]|nr:endonuclease MutS2 [Spirochaetota bacterium]
MNEHALKLLDFFRIRDDVAGYCLSDEGRERVLGSLPSGDAGTVRDLKERSGSLTVLFRGNIEPPRCSFPPIADAVRKLGKEGFALELEELYGIGIWAESFGRLAAFAAKSAYPSQSAEAVAVPDLAPAAAVVFRIISPTGELRDLPELRKAREAVRRINVDIERATDDLRRDETIRGMLQSDLPTVRDGRTVLAVRANFKGRVKGIVHEVSSTGQTVFVEPEALVVKNNQLVEAEARYRREIARILREATAKLSLHVQAIADARVACAALDAVYARARFSYLGRGEFALDAERGLKLLQARHPMLGSTAVPIGFELPEDARTLIITGPNTGGKTVTLKTIGLLALMNQFGLAVPTSWGTALPVFDDVFADIGDEQSIDQSLSTFSGHMKTVSAISRDASGRSLVLLDELGSGTDPEEGCAIAMALLDRFIERGSLCVVTTHHGILKNYGYTKPGVLNASVDFDRNTLSPTYRILMGIPGESRALDIALRNGVPQEIVAGARTYLDEERADVAALIRGLTEKHRELETMETDRKQRLKEAMDGQRKVDLKELRLRQKETELREQGVGDLRRLLQESRKGLENLVREIKEGQIDADKTKAVKTFIADLERTVADEERIFNEAFRDAPATGASGGTFSEGKAVIITSSRKRGVLVRRAKKGSWLVETGTLRVTLPESELAPAPAESATAPKVSVDTVGAGPKPVFELDLRGYRFVEALQAVQAQVDGASLAGLGLFSIIHGTGEGVLGRGIHEYLKTHPAVADYHFARPEEGGFGKTVVRLK